MATRKELSRREFLKTVGIAGAGIAAAGSIGGLVQACGKGATTATTGTSVSTSAESGKELKIGIVMPKTGALSTFAVPFDWIYGEWQRILAPGIVGGDGKNHKVTMTVQDSQSDTARAAAVTGNLITEQGVDMIFAAGAPDTMVPAQAQCETMACPGLMACGPWQPFGLDLSSNPPKPKDLKWSYALCVGTEAMAACYVEMWDALSTNKKVGCNYSNGTDGQAWGDPNNGGPAVFKAGGYQVDETPFYTVGSEDYSSQIAEYKNFKADIISGLMTSSDFTVFWNQCLQQNLKPINCTMAMAVTFATTVQAIGNSAYGLCTEVAWHPDYPYSCSLTGRTDRQIADAYEADTGKQWYTATEAYSLMEVFVQAVKTATDPADKNALVKALSTCKVDTMYGPVDFTTPVDPASTAVVTHPLPTCLRMPTSSAQWRKGKKWPFEQFLVSSKFLPPGTTTVSKVEAMKY
jgi:branched-chain amino acid transport system substrate-binding protein